MNSPESTVSGAVTTTVSPLSRKFFISDLRNVRMGRVQPAPSGAGVVGHAAPVDRLGGEVETTLDLDAVDLEAHALLNVNALLALEVGVLDGVDRRRVGDREPLVAGH